MNTYDPAEVYADNYRFMFRFAYRLLPQGSDKATAEDVAHDAFETAMRSWDSFNGASHIRTWIAGFIRNRVMRRYRDNKAHVRKMEEQGMFDGLEEAAPSAQDVIEQREILAQCRERIAALPPVFLESFELVMIDGMSHREAGAALGCSEGTIGARIWRVRDALLNEERANALAVKVEEGASNITKEGIEVRPGQTWEELDPRARALHGPRFIRIDRVENGIAYSTRGARQIRTRVRNMHKHLRGYVLISQPNVKSYS